MKDHTPKCIPDWVQELTVCDWRALAGLDFGKSQGATVKLDPTSHWRMYGKSREFKIKVDVKLRLGGTVRQFVLKGSPRRREMQFYRAVADSRAGCLPKVYRVWLGDSPDDHHWVLMRYYPAVLEADDLASGMVRAMAEVHATFLGNRRLLTAANWEDSSLYPFTSERSLHRSADGIPVLRNHLSQRWKLPAIGPALRGFVTGKRQWVRDLFSYPKTAIHCDLHPGNYICTDRSGSGIIIDWAAMCVNLPFFDLCRTVDFMAKAPSCDPRRLYSVYQDELKRRGSSFQKLPDLERCILASRTVSKVIRLYCYLVHLRARDSHSWDFRLPMWRTHAELASLVLQEMQGLEGSLLALSAG